MKRLKSTICVLGLTLSLSSVTLAGNIGLPRTNASGNIGLPRASASGNIGLPRASAAGNIGLPRSSRSSTSPFDLDPTLSGNIGLLIRLVLEASAIF